MSVYKCIIIDDDEFIRKSLQDKLGKFFPSLHVVASCFDARQGIHEITVHHPDLVFLDIEMPGMNGFAMLNNIPEIDFEIIFITSFDHYAIKAIRYSALDYLLKPLDVEELRNAIERFTEKRKSSADYKLTLENFIGNLKAKNPEEFKLAIATTSGTLFLPTNDIIRLEAEGSYTIFHLHNNKKMVASRTMKDFAGLLDEQWFIRIHKSHMVNRQYVKSILNSHHVLMTDDSRVEVSRRKWEEVKSRLKKSA